MEKYTIKHISQAPNEGMYIRKRVFGQFQWYHRGRKGCNLLSGRHNSHPDFKKDVNSRGGIHKQIQKEKKTACHFGNRVTNIRS